MAATVTWCGLASTWVAARSSYGVFTKVLRPKMLMLFRLAWHFPKYYPYFYAEINVLLKLFLNVPLLTMGIPL